MTCVNANQDSSSGYHPHSTFGSIKAMKLSVVATLYASAPYVEEFYIRTSAVATAIVGEDFEIIFVNDGSPDNSLAIAIKLSETDPRIKVIDLSRNFGHHRAMMAGLEQTIGELVFLIDSDLEEDPAWLKDFELRLREETVDVVYGVQEARKGRWFERLSGGIFWSSLRSLSGIDFASNQTTARLMSRRYVNALLRFREKELFLHGVMQVVGFDQLPHPVKKTSSSPSTYSLRKRLALFLNSITAFTDAPLKLIFYFGLATSLGASFFAFYLAYRKIAFGNEFEGWTSVMVSVWLLGGLGISFIGIIGIYIAKVFQEVKNRPHTIVRQIYESGKGGDHASSPKAKA